jgi:multiple sugar transport system permease protein
MNLAGRARLNRWVVESAVVVLGAVLIVWSLLPLYNMVRVALQEKEDVFSSNVVPVTPSLHSFWTVFQESYWLLAKFWEQMGNSFWIGIVVASLTLAIGTLTSFTIGRMRIKQGWMLTNAALMTYVIPMSFLAIPFYGIMGKYGMTDNPLAVIAVEVTFATPYAIFIFQQYSASIPYELDEAARIDGASPPQIFFKIYLPLMAPALVAIGTYALLLSWNEYLYAFLLLSNDRQITLSVALGNFLAADDSPWELLMTTGLIYALPPAAIYYAFKRYMVSGLTAGAVKA